MKQRKRKRQQQKVIRKTFDFNTRNEKKVEKYILNLSGIRIRYEIQWVFKWAIFIGYNLNGTRAANDRKKIMKKHMNYK